MGTVLSVKVDRVALRLVTKRGGASQATGPGPWGRKVALVRPHDLPVPGQFGLGNLRDTLVGESMSTLASWSIASIRATTRLVHEP